MSHVLGWTGRISGPEYQAPTDDGYYPEDLIGKAGLGGHLGGCPARHLRPGGGRPRQRGPRGQGAGRSSRSRSRADSLELTIDTKVQKDAQKALKWAMDKIGVKRGAFIAMNPQNGEILAMVSLPAYDNNQFAQGISMTDYSKLLRDPSKPMLNVAISEQYPPGSTYKLVTGTGALADGKISPPRASTPSPSSRSATGSTGSGTERAGARSTSTTASPTPATPSSTSSRAGSASIDWPTGLTSTASESPPASTCPARPAASCPTPTGSGAPRTRSTSPASSTRRASARATT